MDLCVLSDISDFVAIKLPYCSLCAENKLKTKILHTIKITPNDFMSMKEGLRGIIIKCECS